VAQIPFDCRDIVRAAETVIPHDHRASSHNHIDPDESASNKIKDLPKEVGVMLLTAGLVGFILPGPGTPAIIAGGLVLWPEAFGRLESWLERSHPRVHRHSMRQINRFLNDLEKRYPNSNLDNGTC
jgi:hypothetical protein